MATHAKAMYMYISQKPGAFSRVFFKTVSGPRSRDSPGRSSLICRDYRINVLSDRPSVTYLKRAGTYVIPCSDVTAHKPSGTSNLCGMRLALSFL